MIEYTLYRKRLSSCLKWVKCYAQVCSSPCPTIASLFDAPIIGNWYKADCPRYVLDSNTRIQFDRWILGGFTGKDFLISPVDLPRRPGKGSKTIRMYEQVGLEGLNKIQSTPRNILCAFGPVLRTVQILRTSLALAFSGISLRKNKARSKLRKETRERGQLATRISVNSSDEPTLEGEGTWVADRAGIVFSESEFSLTRKKKKLALFFDRKKSPLDKQDWNGQLFRVLSERSPSKRPDPLGYRLDLVGKSFSVRRGAKNGFDRFDLLEREKDKPLFVNEKKWVCLRMGLWNHPTATWAPGEDQARGREGARLPRIGAARLSSFLLVHSCQLWGKFELNEILLEGEASRNHRRERQGSTALNSRAQTQYEREQRGGYIHARLTLQGRSAG
ncbi:hypothetical protein E6C27_scaffold45438G00020 [Cucumis melo var. makuwa]|uniref:Uncharacterized protein n=1 Tax=Cucumis melo var. makuwa TaxID=1194695 RepID=A0A5A7UUB0_CUCMM|nr:hypothetical protein E6C27_scaffold45438G00020 [Cucumis melo var. makuwa]